MKRIAMLLVTVLAGCAVAFGGTSTVTVKDSVDVEKKVERK